MFLDWVWSFSHLDTSYTGKLCSNLADELWPSLSLRFKSNQSFQCKNIKIWNLWNSNSSMHLGQCIAFPILSNKELSFQSLQPKSSFNLRSISPTLWRKVKIHRCNFLAQFNFTKKLCPTVLAHLENPLNFYSVCSEFCTSKICVNLLALKLPVERWWNWHQGSFSSTFYVQLLRQ